MALTGKKKAFAEAKKAGKSNKDAALQAGYSAKTAGPAGSRLVKDPDVVAFLKKKGAAVQQEPAGYAPDGIKRPDAPENWPFGRAAPEVPVATPAPTAAPVLTARAYLSQVVNDLELDEKLRLDAAKKLIEFEEQKPAPKGKKEQREEDAKKPSKFAPSAPPKLVAAGGKKVG